MTTSQMITSSPTTNSSTGFRIYANDNGTLEIVYEGTPSNKCRTDILTPPEVQATLAWDLEHDKRFEPVKEWLEGKV